MEFNDDKCKNVRLRVTICYVVENIKIHVTRENTYKEIYLSSLLLGAYVNLRTYKNTRV